MTSKLMQSLRVIYILFTLYLFMHLIFWFGVATNTTGLLSTNFYDLIKQNISVILVKIFYILILSTCIYAILEYLHYRKLKTTTGEILNNSLSNHNIIVSYLYFICFSFINF